MLRKIGDMLHKQLGLPQHNLKIAEKVSLLITPNGISIFWLEIIFHKLFWRKDFGISK